MAVKKLNAMALARVVSVPFRIPITYIFNKSYREKPFNPGRLIRFRSLAIPFRIGMLCSLSSTDWLIKQL